MYTEKRKQKGRNDMCYMSSKLTSIRETNVAPIITKNACINNE